MEIFKLFGSIFIDNEKADKSIDKTTKKSKSLKDSFKNGLKSAAKFGVGVAAAAAGAVVGMVALAKDVGDTADRLLDLNSITGMSTDEIQRWQRVSTVAGVGAEAVSKAASKLAKNMILMEKDTNKGRIALEQIGISYDDFAEMSADDRMNILVAQLQGVEDATLRAQLGTDLLGGAFEDIAPILDVGVEKLKEVKANADIIPNEGLVKANDFRIMMDQMAERTDVFKQRLAVAFIPILLQMFEMFEKIKPVFMEVFGIVASIVGGIVTSTVENVKYFFGIISDIFGGISEKLFGFSGDSKVTFDSVKVFIGELQAAYEFMRDIVMGVYESLVAAILEFFDKYDEQFQSIIELVKNLGESIWELLKGIFEFAIELWETYGGDVIRTIDFLWEFIKTAFGLLLDVFDVGLKLIEGVVNIFIDIFNGDWKKLWEDIKKLAVDAWNGLWKIVDGLIKAIVDLFVAGISLIGTAFQLIWDGVMKILEGAFSLIGNVIDDIVTSITKAFTSLVDKAMNWGSNMINGFIDGVKNKFEEAKEVVKGLMDGISEFIGFNSPSKKGPGRFITKWGENMVKGFQDGIKNAESDLNLTTENLITSAVAPIERVSEADTGSSSSSAPSGGFNQVVNIYGSENKSPDDVARSVKNTSINLAYEWGLA